MTYVWRVTSCSVRSAEKCCEIQLLYNQDGEVCSATASAGDDGTQTPVQLEEIDHSMGPAVILGSLRQDGHVRGDSCDGVVVESVAG